MKAFHPLLLALSLCALTSQEMAAQTVRPASRKSSLQNLEPGTFSVEGMTPRPITVRVQIEAPVYSNSKYQGSLGSFAPGTVVTLVAVSDTGYRVRGRARHGDVAGWVRQPEVVSADPNLATNLKKLHERTEQVAALIEKNQVAMGMTKEEVEASLGKPSRISARINANGKEERLEYSVYERVPQTTTTQNAFGQIVQSVIYVKVEVGTLAISFKDGVVSELEETKGNPLGGGGAQIVPPPFVF